MEILVNEEELINDVMGNYPEYSSMSLKCNGWKYKECLYRFEDMEDGKIYNVNMEMLKKGLKIFVQMVLDGKDYKDFTGALLDVGDWDGTDTDALVQCAIFGKVIYG